MGLEEGALWRQDGSALVHLAKTSRAICPVNDLCFIIHEMHIKVNTPQYANEG